jgi:hypothetical protein
LCRSLRSKTLAGVESLDEEELAALYALNDTPWSCLKTCNSFGPDDAPVVPECCQLGRVCFSPSPRLVRQVG